MSGGGGGGGGNTPSTPPAKQPPPGQNPPGQNPANNPFFPNNPFGPAPPARRGDGRRSPRRVTLSVSCRGKVCTAHGRVVKPKGTRCGGRISVALRAGKKHVGTGRGRVKANCTFRVRTHIRVSARTARRHHSKIVARASFAGNATLKSKRSRQVRARLR